MTGLEAHLKGCDLKKQSQFTGWYIGTMQVTTIVYGIFISWRRQKTKPIQSQFISYCVLRSEFCGQRQNEQKYLKKQSQFAGLRPEIRNTNL